MRLRYFQSIKVLIAAVCFCMAPPRIFDISQVDLNQVQIDVDGLEAVNPHRGAMRMLDGVIWYNQEDGLAVAFKDVNEQEFWVAGHIPGRPLLPGVLMLEAGAQLASFMTLKVMGKDHFLGFVGCDAVKFRDQVVPGDRLIILCKVLQLRRRRAIFAIQGLVGSKLVFEAQITGMPI